MKKKQLILPIWLWCGVGSKVGIERLTSWWRGGWVGWTWKWSSRWSPCQRPLVDRVMPTPFRLLPRRTCWRGEGRLMQQFHPIAFVDIFYCICITSYIWYLWNFWWFEGMDSTQIVSVGIIVEIAKRAKGSLYGSISVSSAQPLPLSSHSGSHNPPSPTNLLPDLPIKSLMPHFMPPRVRTYLVLQHTCTCRLQWKPFSEMKLCRARIYFSFSVFYSNCFCICFKNHWSQIWILSQL